MTDREQTLAERPRVESVEDIWCWANIWGDLNRHRKHAAPDKLAESWEKGYAKAIGDLMLRLSEMGIEFEQAREKWPKWSGMRLLRRG